MEKDSLVKNIDNVLDTGISKQDQIIEEKFDQRFLRLSENKDSKINNIRNISEYNQAKDDLSNAFLEFQKNSNEEINLSLFYLNELKENTTQQLKTSLKQQITNTGSRFLKDRLKHSQSILNVIDMRPDISLIDLEKIAFLFNKSDYFEKEQPGLKLFIHFINEFGLKNIKENISNIETSNENRLNIFTYAENLIKIHKVDTSLNFKIITQNQDIFSDFDFIFGYLEYLESESTNPKTTIKEVIELANEMKKQGCTEFPIKFLLEFTEDQELRKYIIQENKKNIITYINFMKDRQRDGEEVDEIINYMNKNEIVWDKIGEIDSRSNGLFSIKFLTDLCDLYKGGNEIECNLIYCLYLVHGRNISHIKEENIYKLINHEGLNKQEVTDYILDMDSEIKEKDLNKLGEILGYRIDYKISNTEYQKTLQKYGNNKANIIYKISKEEKYFDSELQKEFYCIPGINDLLLYINKEQPILKIGNKEIKITNSIKHINIMRGILVGLSNKGLMVPAYNNDSQRGDIFKTYSETLNIFIKQKNPSKAFYYGPNPSNKNDDHNGAFKDIEEFRKRYLCNISIFQDGCEDFGRDNNKISPQEFIKEIKTYILNNQEYISKNKINIYIGGHGGENGTIGYEDGEFTQNDFEELANLHSNITLEIQSCYSGFKLDKDNNISKDIFLSSSQQSSYGDSGLSEAIDNIDADYDGDGKTSYNEIKLFQIINDNTSFHPLTFNNNGILEQIASNKKQHITQYS